MPEPFRKHGQSSMELIAGLLILIPLVFFFLDIGVMMAAGICNVDVCKRAARAASSVLNNSGQSDGKTAFQAAQSVCGAYQTSQIIRQVQLTYFEWKPNSGASFTEGKPASGQMSPLPGEVLCVTNMTLALPVILPGLPPTIDCVVNSTQPIVGLPPIIPSNPGNGPS